MLAAIAAAFLAIPALAHVPARLVTACAKWIALAVALELLSMLGFVLVFALVFGRRLGARQRIGAGLRALAAITVLPAGGLIGPVVAAQTADVEARPLPALTQSMVALTILTNAPELLVLGGLGFALWLGWPPGPHSPRGGRRDGHRRRCVACRTPFLAPGHVRPQAASIQATPPFERDRYDLPSRCSRSAPPRRRQKLEAGGGGRLLRV
jgi:hypothetical protein